MKSLRNSPAALAAAALMAAPTAGAQPMQLTPPPLTEDPSPAPSPPAPPAQAEPTSAPAAAVAAAGQDVELRGPVGPLPNDLSLSSQQTSAPAPQPEPAPQAAAQVSPPPPAPAPSPPAPPPPRMASTPDATVSVAAQADFTRLAFRFGGPTSVTPSLTGNRLELRFSRAADIDIAELRATPPRFVREVRRTSAAGAPVRLIITLDHGVRQRHFVDGDRVIVDLLGPQGGAQSADGAAPAALAPVTGTARVQLVEEADVTRVTVTWPAPARAAAFRRGEAIWILFDATGRVDIAGVARAGRRHRDVEVVRGEGVIGLRIPAPPEMQVSASARDESWTFTLGARAEAGSGAVLAREILPDGRARLVAQFGREGVVRWIADPEIGDRIGVALIGGPAKGVDARRATVEAAVLPAAHGAVIEPRADEVSARFDGGALIVTRGDGLLAGGAAQSPTAASLSAALISESMGAAGAPQAGGAASAPSANLVDVRRRMDDLMRRAALEGVAEGAPVAARMALARFLIEHEFAAEALGALRIVAINQGELVEIDPDFRLMRGAANVMMGRMSEANADLAASALADNPSAMLWRGYAHAQRHEWAEARQLLERGAGALEEHPSAWRARFQLALAEAAFELNDFATAEAAASAAMGQAPTQTIRLQARFIQARLALHADAARGLQMLDELAGVRDEEIAVRATVEALRVRRLRGEITAQAAIDPLEALRFRWRGDSTELAIVGLLGDVYSELGRWRDAMATMRIASDRFPMEPAARQLRADMANLFERLFLDGEADQLEPIQALGLFYEFSDITPVGPNGDRIVRLLAGRLVHVDLLEQAAQLLQHQVDERLDGLSRAQVAGDLAAIYLMDRKPDRALVAIASSRQPNMPQTLLADRRILEARALLDLGRLDAAVELVERDRSEDAQRVRAEAAWRARDWDRAAVELRGLLALRQRAAPLDAHARLAVLRAGVAYTLAGNDDGARALYREFAGDMAGTDEAVAFEVVASGVTADGAAIRDVARAVARSDLLDRFMQRLRADMTANAAAQQAAAPQPAAQTPAPAQPRPAAPPTG